MSRQRVFIGVKKYYQHPVVSNYSASKDGEIINIKTQRIMKMSKSRNGYHLFSLSDKKLLKQKTYYEHRFFYEVFKGEIPEGFEVDHINNCQTENRIKNLQLLNHQQNVEKSKSKAIVSINIENSEEKIFISIKSASIELNINVHIFMTRHRGQKYLCEFVYNLSLSKIASYNIHLQLCC